MRCEARGILADREVWKECDFLGFTVQLGRSGGRRGGKRSGQLGRKGVEGLFVFVAASSFSLVELLRSRRWVSFAGRGGKWGWDGEAIVE